ncbi:cell division protein FtsK [Mycobacteroides abscessus]|uniref:cell division protein FtsK n=1 Tax=Mycobacteroides abscessus TaxID=36809 RepID=UPI0019D145A0|nr:cell division protein FtsK [Mycobacteroides abscessus]MBN7314908.1 cell division protein FtsK [Mycobacteroides abscessus subsp. abscessus]
MSRDARRAALARKQARKQERREELFFQRDIKVHDANSLAAIKDSEKADIEREKLAERLEAIAQRAANDAQHAVGEREKFWSGEEKRILSQPRTVRTGGSAGIGPIWLSHWRASLPAVLATRLGVSPSDAGPVFALRPGGGISQSDVISAVVRCEAPELASDAAFVGWADGVESLLPDVARRYAMLELVRDDAWLARLLEAADIATPKTCTEQVQGEYGVYERKLTAVDVPALVAAGVERSGLRLVFGHQAGRSARDWSVKLDALRAAFGHAGVNARNLRVADSADGRVVLDFNDTDPLDEQLPSIITPYDAARGRSYVGQAADGSDIWITLHNNACGLVAGMQGGGKTASLMPVLAGMAGHVELHLLDGAGSGEWSALKPLCASYDDSAEISALGDLLESLIPVARERVRRVTAETGHINFWDVPATEREKLGLFPVLVVIEEAPQYLSEGQADKDSKVAAQRNGALTGKAVKVMRKAGISLVLIAQKPTDKEVPSIIRDNAGWRLAFRLDSDVAAATVLGDSAYQEPKPTSIPPGKPGRFVGRVDTRGSVLGQAVYVPISDIRAALADATPVPDQRAMFAQPVSAPEPEAESQDVTALSAPAPEKAKPARTPRKRPAPATEKKAEIVTETPARPSPRTDLDGW